MRKKGKRARSQIRQKVKIRKRMDSKICRVLTNHIRVHVNWLDFYKIQQYDVSISPVTSHHVNHAVIEEFVNNNRELGLPDGWYAYDGSRMLYTLGELNWSSYIFKITLQDKEGDPGDPKALQRNFDVMIKHAGSVSTRSSRKLYNLLPDHVPQAILQGLNIILRKFPTEWYDRSAGSICSPYQKGHQQLGEVLESRRGFHQSIQPTQRGLMLNIDLSSTICIKPLLVMDFLKILLNRDISDTPLSGTDLLKVKKALKGVKVHVLRNMHNEYHVSDVTSQPAKELTHFFRFDSRRTREPGKTVVQHFEERYGVSIKYKSLNCLEVGTTKRPEYLPMEVCKIAKGQPYSKQLKQREQMADFLKVPKQRPYERERDILEALPSVSRNPRAVKLGIKIEEELVSLPARILPPPLLKFNDRGKTRAFLPHYGLWNMKSKKMVKGGRVNSWTCINFSIVQQREATNFCSLLANMCRASGMEFNVSPVLPVETAKEVMDKPVLLQPALTSLHKKVMDKLGPDRNLDLLVVILPDKNGSLYGDLKRICETDIGLVSQCCLAKHVLRMNKQYLASVALKLNVKMGGRNTVLNDAIEKKLPHIGDTPTIIFGAFVTHPHPGKCSSPSIASVVASQDWPEVTRYAGLVSAQCQRHEWINNLFEPQYDGKKAGGMICEHLISFYQATGQKPQRIIFYRDGLSKGQYSQVLKEELGAIQKACELLEENYKPTVTYVVVQKRHRTRLFPKDYRDTPCDLTGNLWPGTVVESVICRRKESDFYLCSHSCSHAEGRGTIRPIYYHVLCDENKFPADAFQKLTYYLCYMYAGCTHSISVVPPLRYARRLASRAHCYIKPQSSESAAAATVHLPFPMVVGLFPIKDNLKGGMFFC